MVSHTRGRQGRRNRGIRAGCTGRRPGPKKISSVYDIYQLVVGEIGIPSRQFLYELRLWEIKRIIRGYRVRQRTSWEQIRWQTFWLLHNGMLDCQKAGITTPADLIRFPWDQPDPVTETDQDDTPTTEDIEAMRKELQQLNAQRRSHPGHNPDTPLPKS